MVAVNYSCKEPRLKCGKGYESASVLETISLKKQGGIKKYLFSKHIFTFKFRFSNKHFLIGSLSNKRFFRYGVYMIFHPPIKLF